MHKLILKREERLTRAVFSIPCEAIATEAQVTPNDVDTLCKLAAAIGSRFTFIHIYKVGTRKRED